MPENTQDQSQTADTQSQTPQGDTNQQQQQTTQAQNTGTGQNTGSNTQRQEDRSNWIPPHRLREVSERERASRTENETLRRQIAALTGTQRPTADQAKSEELREALFELMPQLRRFSQLNDEQLEQLLETPQIAQSVKQAEQQKWDTYRDQMVDKVSSKLSERIGVSELSQDQREDLDIAFRNYIFKRYSQEVEQHGTSTTAARYEKGDEKLLDEFVERYAKNWFEPARRQVTSKEVKRAAHVPNSTRQPVTGLQKPASFKSLEERLDFAAKLGKERGMTFERE